MELHARGLGAAVLRALARRAQVAAAQTVRTLRGDARPTRAGIAAYCQPENKVALGFVEALNNKIRVVQRRAYGLRDEEYLRLKVLTMMLPPL